MIEVTLPYPPSINHYWRHFGPRVLISREGRAYRERVCSVLAERALPIFTGPLAVTIEVFPPDNRRRDLDNLQKSLLDSMQQGGLYLDDSQIVDLHAIRRGVTPPGKVVVRMEEVSRA